MTACAHDSLSDQAYFADFHRRVSEARIPVDGSIELTHRCNLRCVHCYLGDQKKIRRHRKQEMTTGEIKSLLDQVVAAGALNFTFSGGDPMIRKDFAELYVYAIKKGLLVTVFCDGVLITDRIIEVFNRYPPRKIEISIYGASEDTYEKTTQVKGSFRRCLQGIERLHTNAHRFTLKTVLMTHNRHELEAMRKMADDYGAGFYFDTDIFPCLPHGDNGGRSNLDRAERPSSIAVAPPSLARPLELRLSPEAAAEARLSDPEAIEELADLYVRTKDIPESEYLYTCGAGLTTFHVDPYGNLQPCTISTNGDFNLLRDGSFTQGWNGPIAALRKLKVRNDGTCNSCDKQSMCGGCPAFFFAENGAGDVKSDYVCRTTHLVFEGLQDSVNTMLEGPT
jgi:radical SAM protein with 4Fe4S-binding SPASM domain